MSEPKCQEALLYFPPLTTACLNIPSLDTYLQDICQIKVNAFMFYLQIPLQFSIKQSLGAVLGRRVHPEHTHSRAAAAAGIKSKRSDFSEFLK